jgi:hypothetical protein
LAGAEECSAKHEAMRGRTALGPAAGGGDLHASIKKNASTARGACHFFYAGVHCTSACGFFPIAPASVT